MSGAANHMVADNLPQIQGTGLGTARPTQDADSSYDGKWHRLN